MGCGQSNASQVQAEPPKQFLGECIDLAALLSLLFQFLWSFLGQLLMPYSFAKTCGLPHGISISELRLHRWNTGPVSFLFLPTIEQDCEVRGARGKGGGSGKDERTTLELHVTLRDQQFDLLFEGLRLLFWCFPFQSRRGSTFWVSGYHAYLGSLTCHD